MSSLREPARNYPPRVNRFPCPGFLRGTAGTIINSGARVRLVEYWPESRGVITARPKGGNASSLCQIRFGRGTNVWPAYSVRANAVWRQQLGRPSGGNEEKRVVMRSKTRSPRMLVHSEAGRSCISSKVYRLTNSSQCIIIWMS